MDPDQALSDLRDMFIKGDIVNLSIERQAELFREARESFEGLDEFISNGGFLPQEWSSHGGRRAGAREPVRVSSSH